MTNILFTDEEILAWADRFLKSSGSAFRHYRCGFDKGQKILDTMREIVNEAAATPAPFWRPIAELKKKPNQRYLVIYEKGGIAMVGTGDNPENSYAFERQSTHFAEIPPLPHQEAVSADARTGNARKDEVKP